MPLTITAVQIAQVVKQKTAGPHTEVEAILIPKLKNIESIEDYTAILRSFYGSFHPLEESIQKFITPTILPDITSRRTSRLILNDLSILGDTAPIKMSTALPAINNVNQAFGVLYVLEGSTLGGKVIAKMLSKNNFIPEQAIQFFNGYGQETGLMWTNFVSTLNQQNKEEEIVNAANETFYHLKNWMQSSPE